jgi:hypothetical protein
MNKSIPTRRKDVTCFSKFLSLFSVFKTKEIDTEIQVSVIQASMVIDNKPSNEEIQEERPDGIKINTI